MMIYGFFYQTGIISLLVLGSSKLEAVPTLSSGSLLFNYCFLESFFMTISNAPKIIKLATESETTAIMRGVEELSISYELVSLIKASMASAAACFFNFWIFSGLTGSLALPTGR